MPSHEDKKKSLVNKAAGGKKDAGSAGRGVQRVPITLGAGPGQVSARPGNVANKEVARAGKQCGLLLAKKLKHHRHTTAKLCKSICHDAPWRAGVEAEPVDENGGSSSSKSTSWQANYWAGDKKPWNWHQAGKESSSSSETWQGKGSGGRGANAVSWQHRPWWKSAWYQGSGDGKGSEHHRAPLHQGKGSGNDSGAGKGDSEAKSRPGRGSARDDRAAGSGQAPERAERACKKAASKVCKSELQPRPYLPKLGRSCFLTLGEIPR